MANNSNLALLGILALSLCVNILQFASDTPFIRHCPQSDAVQASCAPAASSSKCPPCRCAKCSSSGNINSDGQDADNKDAGESPAEPEDAPAAAGDGAYNGEIGWRLGLAREAEKTDNTKYDPAEDAVVLKSTGALGGKYAASPIPRSSWKVRVGGNRWITMDDAIFAYDIWFEENRVFQYMSWLGVFVQQDPADAMVIQQMLWTEKPDLVVEIGTNTGGGAIFYYSIMSQYNKDAKVVTLDVKPCCENWNKRNNHRCEGCITGEKHPLWTESGNIHFIQGRVTDAATREKVEPFVKAAKKVIVIEDASHRYPDTLQNIEAVHQWVSVGTYMLVQDTKMDRFVAALKKKHGRYKFGPMRSVDEFVAKHKNFVIDRKFEYLLYSQHHRGWLKKTAAN